MALPSALIRGDGGFGSGDAGEPLGMHLPHVMGYSLCLLRWGRGLGLALLLRQVTRMHDNTA